MHKGRNATPGPSAGQLHLDYYNLFVGWTPSVYDWTVAANPDCCSMPNFQSIQILPCHPPPLWPPLASCCSLHPIWRWCLPSRPSMELHLSTSKHWSDHTSQCEQFALLHQLAGWYCDRLEQTKIASDLMVLIWCSLLSTEKPYCHCSWFYVCVLCLVSYVLKCSPLLVSLHGSPLCYFLYVLCIFLFLLACLSPSVCQYCFLHTFSIVSFPHYLTCPPPSSLPTCSSFPHQCVCVFKPWFPMYSLSVRCLFCFPWSSCVTWHVSCSSAVCFWILISVFFLCLIWTFCLHFFFWSLDLFLFVLFVYCIQFLLNKAHLLFSPALPLCFCILVHLLVWPFNTMIPITQ